MCINGHINDLCTFSKRFRQSWLSSKSTLFQSIPSWIYSWKRNFDINILKQGLSYLAKDSSSLDRNKEIKMHQSNPSWHRNEEVDKCLIPWSDQNLQMEKPISKTGSYHDKSNQFFFFFSLYNCILLLQYVMHYLVANDSEFCKRTVRCTHSS